MSFIERYRRAMTQIRYQRAWAKNDVASMLEPYTTKK